MRGDILRLQPSLVAVSVCNDIVGAKVVALDFQNKKSGTVIVHHRHWVWRYVVNHRGQRLPLELRRRQNTDGNGGGKMKRIVSHREHHRGCPSVLATGIGQPVSWNHDA